MSSSSVHWDYCDPSCSPQHRMTLPSGVTAQPAALGTQQPKEDCGLGLCSVLGTQG